MKTKMRKEIRKVVGPTMREALANHKEKKNDDGIPGLIVTGLAMQPPEGLHEVKAAAQAAIENRMASQQSTSWKLRTSNEQTISTPPEGMPAVITDSGPILLQTSAPQSRPKGAPISPILPAAAQGRPIIQDAPIKEGGPPTTKNIRASIAEPPESQIAKPFFDKLAAIPPACQIDSDANGPENDYATIAEQAHPNIEEPLSQALGEGAAPSSTVCDLHRDAPQPNHVVFRDRNYVE